MSKDNKLTEEELALKLKELEEKETALKVKEDSLVAKEEEANKKEAALKDAEAILAAKEAEVSEKKLTKESLSTGEQLAKEKKVTIVVPKSELNPHETVVPVTINGYTYQIKRGEEVEVPQTVKNILKETKYI